MADENKGQEEYQYPPEEYYKGGEYLPDENLEPTEDEVSQVRRRPGISRRLLFLIGFALAIVLVYLLLSYFNAQRNADLSQPTSTSATAAIPPTTQTVTTVQPTVPAQPVTVDNPATDAQVQRLTMQNQANQQTIANLQAQVQQLQSQLGDMTNTISSLGSQIQILVNEIRAIGLDRAVAGRSTAITQGIVYHLKALVPGRAWLEAPNGRATTVTIGDRLPGYGIIQMINTNQGIVTTSSGAVIEYGPKDN